MKTYTAEVLVVLTIRADDAGVAGSIAYEAKQQIVACAKAQRRSIAKLGKYTFNGVEVKPEPGMATKAVAKPKHKKAHKPKAPKAPKADETPTS